MSEPLTLASLWSSGFSNQTALIIPEGGPWLTYGKLGKQIESLAEALRRGGVQPGDPVAIVLPNGLEYLTTFLAEIGRAHV